MELRDDIEDCEDFQEDFYGDMSTTSARAKLCGQCVNYTIKNRLLTCIRCNLGIRPKVDYDDYKKIWKASCHEFKKR